jgi:hypothetical protein
MNTRLSDCKNIRMFGVIEPEFEGRIAVISQTINY